MTSLGNQPDEVKPTHYKQENSKSSLSWDWCEWLKKLFEISFAEIF